MSSHHPVITIVSSHVSSVCSNICYNERRTVIQIKTDIKYRGFANSTVIRLTGYVPA